MSSSQTCILVLLQLCRMTDPFHAMPPCSDDSATKRRKEAESRLKDADDARNGAAGACPCPCISYMAARLPILAMRTKFG